jgi:transmembrane sensor
MANARLNFLFQLHVNHQLNAEEEEEFMRLLTDPKNKEAKELLAKAWEEFEPDTPVFTNLQGSNMLNNILAADVCENQPVKAFNWQRLFAAAAILLLIFSIGVMLIPKSAKKENLNIAHNTIKKYPLQSDVAPGSSKAVLTLADGTKITLDDQSAGKIANQSGVNISKTADGQLVYAFIEQHQSKENKPNLIPQINTITTPKGGQYQINLPDGSKVWLNAMSSLKFPAIFQGKERKVELTGEAYFEISSFYLDKIKLPFKVLSHTTDGRSQEVEVLGTHFNINAYENEPSTKTTLLEGSVKVTNLNSRSINILLPGQQAILNTDKSKVTQIDKEEIMAWKNGNFLFNNLPLVDIMKQLERWYDIKVDYANIPHTRYQGVISKYVSISQVLNMLELTGNLKFKIDSIPGKAEKRIEILKQ